MNKQTKKIIAIALIVLGISSIITTSLNLQVTMGDAEAFLAGQVALPVPPALTWGLNLAQAIGLVCLVLVGKFKKTNLFWVLLLPVGCIVIGMRQLLRLNKDDLD